MPIRKAEAEWKANLVDGAGRLKVGSGAFEGQYSFASRFEEGTGTNPEELVGAAHAGCYSMALAAGLKAAGFTPERIRTKARVHFDQRDGNWTIHTIELNTEASVKGITPEDFQKRAEATKTACPVSRALTGVTIQLTAKLI